MPARLSDHRPLGFALCHGWGLDAASLRPLANALLGAFSPDTVHCELFDLGFGGQAQRPQLDPERAWVAVGHSQGFAWLLQQAASDTGSDVGSDTESAEPASGKTDLPPWQAAVSLNGFTRFCRQPGQAEGTPVRLLDAMLARLEQDPLATVQEFRQRCGLVAADPVFALSHLTDSAGSTARQALQQHLLALRTLDLPLPALPLLALATADDAIVSPALAQACFGAPDTAANVRLHQLAGDHVSLLRQPQMLAGLICTWLEHTDE